MQLMKQNRHHVFLFNSPPARPLLRLVCMLCVMRVLSQLGHALHYEKRPYNSDPQ